MRTICLLSLVPYMPAVYSKYAQKEPDLKDRGYFEYTAGTRLERRVVCIIVRLVTDTTSFAPSTVVSTTVCLLLDGPDVITVAEICTRRSARLDQSYGLLFISLTIIYMTPFNMKHTVYVRTERHQDDVWGKRSLERTLYITDTPSITVRSLMHMATVWLKC